MQVFEELFEIAKKLNEAAAERESDEIAQPLALLEEAANQVKRSFSGSWLGYHSRVYYEELLPPPPGANFSQEWGLKDLSHTSLGSRGDWCEYDKEEVKKHICKLAKNPNLKPPNDASDKAAEVFDKSKSEVLSIFENELDHKPDAFISKLKTDLESFERMSSFEVAQHWCPKGQIMTRDMIAWAKENWSLLILKYWLK
jgi:hypothetical protein